MNILNYGTFIVQVESIMVSTTKTTGRPCLSVKYVVADGEFTGTALYQTQLLTTPYGVKCACDLLRSMDCLFPEQLENSCVGQTEGVAYCAYQVYKLRDTVAYELEYSVNAKGYNEYRITGVFDISADDEDEEVAPAHEPIADNDMDSNYSDDETPNFDNDDDDDLLPF